MSKKFLDIQDQHSKILGHRILNSQLSLYLGILQLIVCLWSLTQHVFSMLVLNTVLHCDFSSNSTLPALLTSVDAIIFDFGLFHSLWGINGCVAQHLDGGYGRFGWCITHTMALIFCLPFAFVSRPKPYYLWPLLIQQSAYGIGLLILSLAALPRVLPIFMGDLTNAPIHAIFFYTTGTLMNFFLLYIYWHWYWYVEAQWDSARKIRSSQLQNSHNSRTGSLHGYHRQPINNKYLISEFASPTSVPIKEHDQSIPVTNGITLSNGHAFIPPNQNGQICLGQQPDNADLSPPDQNTRDSHPEASRKYSVSPRTSSLCSDQSGTPTQHTKALEAICSADREVQQQVVRQSRKFPPLPSSSPASSQASGMQPAPVLPVQQEEQQHEPEQCWQWGHGDQKTGQATQGGRLSGQEKVSVGAANMKQGPKARNDTKAQVRKPQPNNVAMGITNMGTLAIQRQRQKPAVPRILPNHLPSPPVVHPISHSSAWFREDPLYGQRRQYSSFSQPHQLSLFTWKQHLFTASTPIAIHLWASTGPTSEPATREKSSYKEIS
uniref:Uncharacterized protein n=1 Tax=Ditylenchus dipsaci TaxID=166011 RepID=A0A915CTI6_9BILA